VKRRCVVCDEKECWCGLSYCHQCWDSLATFRRTEGMENDAIWAARRARRFERARQRTAISRAVDHVTRQRRK